MVPSFPGLIPSPLPHLSMPKKTGVGGGEQKPAFLRGRCLGIRARWGCGSGLVGFLLLLIGQQNLRQVCQQLKHGQILVLWSLNIIKFGGLSLSEKITNAIDLKLLLLKYLTFAIFTKTYDHVNTLLEPSTLFEHKKRPV